MNPNDKVPVFTPGIGTEASRETYKDTNLNHLPGEILFSLARNESATREWRKAAVELLIDKRCPQAGHAELAVLANEIRAEREARNDVESVVETAIESEIPQSPALTASVTTTTLQMPQPAIQNIQHTAVLTDDARGE